MEDLNIETDSPKDLFQEDNFSSRRTTGCNMYDPESLLTGKEIENGLGYADKRDYSAWPGLYTDIVEGRVKASDVPLIAPRTRPEKPVRLPVQSKFELRLSAVFPIEPAMMPSYVAYVVQDGNVVQVLTGDLPHIARKFQWYVQHWQMKNGKFGQRYLRYWENGGRDIDEDTQTQR
jgi:hypothetical protein